MDLDAASRPGLASGNWPPPRWSANYGIIGDIDIQMQAQAAGHKEETAVLDEVAAVAMFLEARFFRMAAGGFGPGS
jgi:hypothetical protein